jgi:glycosyltransferase involved in cell wall biosynthesis
MVQCNDAAAATGAIRRILTEPGLGARISANARRKAEQFDWAQVLPLWDRTFLETLHGYRQSAQETLPARQREVDR